MRRLDLLVPLLLLLATTSPSEAPFSPLPMHLSGEEAVEGALRLLEAAGVSPRHVVLVAESAKEARYDIQPFFSNIEFRNEESLSFHLFFPNSRSLGSAFLHPTPVSVRTLHGHCLSLNEQQGLIRKEEEEDGKVGNVFHRHTWATVILGLSMLFRLHQEDAPTPLSRQETTTILDCPSGD